METARKSVNVLQGAGQSEVHKVVNRCRKGHTSDKCRLNGAKCGKIGHIQRSCKASPQKPRRVTSNQKVQPLNKLLRRKSFC